MRRNPFEELEEMLERMSKQVEEGVGGVGTASVAVDVRDEGDAYVVTADLPGYEADDVDLTLSGKRLELSAERDVEYETAGEADDGGSEDGAGTVDYVRRERRRSSVTRTVRLPEEVDPEGVEADLDNGVLTVHLPKAHAEEGHRIDIDDS